MRASGRRGFSSQCPPRALGVLDSRRLVSQESVQCFWKSLRFFRHLPPRPVSWLRNELRKHAGSVREQNSRCPGEGSSPRQPTGHPQTKAQMLMYYWESREQGPQTGIQSWPAISVQFTYSSGWVEGGAIIVFL